MSAAECVPETSTAVAHAPLVTAARVPAAIAKTKNEVRRFLIAPPYKLPAIFELRSLAACFATPAMPSTRASNRAGDERANFPRISLSAWRPPQKAASSSIAPTKSRSFVDPPANPRGLNNTFFVALLPID